MPGSSEQRVVVLYLCPECGELAMTNRSEVGIYYCGVPCRWPAPQAEERKYVPRDQYEEARRERDELQAKFGTKAERVAKWAPIVAEYARLYDRWKDAEAVVRAAESFIDALYHSGEGADSEELEDALTRYRANHPPKPATRGDEDA